MLSTSESMTYLTVVGGVDRAALLNRLAMHVRALFAGCAAKRMSKAVSARTAQRNADVAKSELETPAWACRSSRNAVETPVDAAVLISPRINHIAKLLQCVAGLVVCITVARKEGGAFRGNVIGNKPRMRFIFSTLRKNVRKTGVSLFASRCFSGCSYLFGYQTNNVRGI